MGYRILALDIDGTLTNSKKQVTPKTKQAIRKLQEQGVIVVLASGRPTRGVMPLAKEIELEQYGGYILSFNGGRTVNCKTGEVILDFVLPAELVSDIYDMSQECGVHIMTYENGEVITETPDDPYACLEARINWIPIRGIDSFKEYVTFPINKCLMLAEDQKLAVAEQKVKKRFPMLNIYRSEPFFLEIMPQYIDKAYCLEKLLERLHLTREELVCCGDGYNDLSMVKFAGLGIAMENAQEPVKQAADFITRSNEEDGVAYAIEKFFG